MQHVEAVDRVDCELAVATVVVLEEEADVLADAVIEMERRGMAIVVATVGLEASDGGGVGGDSGWSVGTGCEEVVNAGQMEL
jgi:hypothetical protein